MILKQQTYFLCLHTNISSIKIHWKYNVINDLELKQVLREISVLNNSFDKYKYTIELVKGRSSNIERSYLLHFINNYFEVTT